MLYLILLKLLTHRQVLILKSSVDAVADLLLDGSNCSTSHPELPRQGAYTVTYKTYGRKYKIIVNNLHLFFFLKIC